MYTDVPEQYLPKSVEVRSAFTAYLYYREQEKKDRNVRTKPKEAETAQRTEDREKGEGNTEHVKKNQEGDMGKLQNNRQRRHRDGRSG